MMRLIIALTTLLSGMSCVRLQKPVHWVCGDEAEPLLETVTYNAGLAPGVVMYATPRTAMIAERIGALRGVGLICLQEVWETEAQELIIEALDLPEENVFRESTAGEGESDGENHCDEDLVASLMSCVHKKCGEYADEDKSICATDQCYVQLARIYLTDKQCFQCLLSMVGHSPDEIKEACTSDGGQGRTYHGSNGTILASRWPLKNREALRLPSSGVNRVVLLATVDIPGYGEVEVGCTHLSTETYLDPIVPGFDSWEDEMTAQFDIAEKRLGERAGDRPQLFLGDFNAGPSRGGYGPHWPPTHRGVKIVRSAPRVWHEIVRSGFRSAVADARPTFCTTCNDNDLRGSGNNHLIDHVLLRDPPGGLDLEPACTYPYFDEPVPVMTLDGETTTLNLSDHYAAVVKYRLRLAP